MKTNANDPINAITHEGYPSRIKSVIDKDGLATGLTKREYFAAMAMQGLLANPYFSNPVPYSVEYADALIKQLNK